MIRTCAILTAAGLLVACEAPRGEASAWLLVRNDPSDPVPTWTTTEVLRIGSVSDGPAAFGDIGGLAVDSAKRIYLLDWQAQDVRMFDSTGAFVRTVARRGEGPGEISGGAGLSVDREQDLWVWDVRLERFTVFDSAGRVLRTVHRKAIGSEFPWVGRFDDEGRLYDVQLGVHGDIQELTAFRLAADFGTWRPLSTLKGRLDLTSSGVRKPLSGVLVLGIDPKGARWVAHQRAARFWKVAVSGDTVLESDIEGVAPTVDRRTRDSVANLRWGPEGRVTAPDIPEHRVAFRKFWVGAAGDIYVALTGADSLENRVFDVLDPDGKRVAELDVGVKLETGPMPQVHGPFLYGTTKDSLDVEYFVKLAIHRFGSR